MEAFYNENYGTLVIKPTINPEDNIVIHNLDTFIEAWQALFDNGFDLSGFVRVDLGPELGEALQATNLEYVGHPVEGTP